MFVLAQTLFICLFQVNYNKDFRDLFTRNREARVPQWGQASKKPVVCKNQIKIFGPIAPNSELCNIRECVVRPLTCSHNSACPNVTVMAVMQTFPPFSCSMSRVRQPTFPVNDLGANNTRQKQKRNICTVSENPPSTFKIAYHQRVWENPARIHARPWCEGRRGAFANCPVMKLEKINLEYLVLEYFSNLPRSSMDCADLMTWVLDFITVSYCAENGPLECHWPALTRSRPPSYLSPIVSFLSCAQMLPFQWFGHKTN